VVSERVCDMFRGESMIICHLYWYHQRLLGIRSEGVRFTGRERNGCLLGETVQVESEVTWSIRTGRNFDSYY